MVPYSGWLQPDVCNFENCAHCEKYLKDSKDNSLHLRRKHTRIFVLGHYQFLVAHSFSRATLSENCPLLVSEQIMSADKYPCIFSRQMAAIVYIRPNMNRGKHKYLKKKKIKFRRCRGKMFIFSLFCQILLVSFFFLFFFTYLI